MAKKYYGVQKGREPGVYLDWASTQAQIKGYSGAVFKSFATREEAAAFACGAASAGENDLLALGDGAIAYVDGSYEHRLRTFSCGVVFRHEGVEVTFAQAYTDPELAEMRNVAGELKGAAFAMGYALAQGIPQLTIYHDYTGIAHWCTGAWQAKKPGTIAYRDYYRQVAETVDIRFVKVQGHSGDAGNEWADRLAKEAIEKQLLAGRLVQMP